MTEHFEEEPVSPIGAALGLIRRHRGMSEERLAGLLAEAAGETVTPEYVARVEQERVRLSWERLHVFCTHLGCLPSHAVKLAELIADGGSEAEIDEVMNGLPPAA